MIALLLFLLRLLVSPFRSISRLEAENTALRRQLIVLQRQVRGRVQFTNSDRLFFLQLYRWFPSIAKAMTTIRPETLVRWHRAGFRRYWRWKSRNLGGRPPIDAGLRTLIRRMSIENWAANVSDLSLLKISTGPIRLEIVAGWSYRHSHGDDSLCHFFGLRLPFSQPCRARTQACRS
jgi:hypothetical protein